MVKRMIVKIDEEKCNGCGLCVPNCPEGALQIIDGKARLVGELLCDGLGACLGQCPQGAITIEKRDADAYDERKVMENIIKQGRNVIKAHLEHLKNHNEEDLLEKAQEVLKEKGIENPLAATEEGLDEIGRNHRTHGFSGCPGSKVMDFGREDFTQEEKYVQKKPSELRQWPVQITLVPPSAPYLNNADLLITADCVPFAYADFHQDLLKGKVLLVGCPKLDDIGRYKEKIAQIIKNNDVKSITHVHMEVPCCYGLNKVIKSTIADSGKDVPFKDITISIKGKKLS